MHRPKPETASRPRVLLPITGDFRFVPKKVGSGRTKFVTEPGTSAEMSCCLGRVSHPELVEKEAIENRTAIRRNTSCFGFGENHFVTEPDTIAVEICNLRNMQPPRISFVTEPGTFSGLRRCSEKSGRDL